MTAREHHDLVVAIQRELSHGSTRLFLTNSGIAWQGNIVERTDKRLVLINYRPIHFGALGMADLTGFTQDPHAIYTAIEVKTGTGRPTKEQLAFIEMVKSKGGRAGIARSIADAKLILTTRVI